MKLFRSVRKAKNTLHYPYVTTYVCVQMTNEVWVHVCMRAEPRTDIRGLEHVKRGYWREHGTYGLLYLVILIPRQQLLPHCLVGLVYGDLFDDERQNPLRARHQEVSRG